MSDSVAGVVLAAGRGERLRPLTLRRPKALCPIDNVALVDLALDRLRTVAADVAVNVHHHRAAMEAHLEGRARLSVEEAEPLGTAGALGHLREWIAGRPVVVVNADAWCPGPLDHLLDGWDGERLRVLVAGSEVMGPSSQVAGALLPWSDVARLEPVPSGLWETCWRAALGAARLEAVPHHGPFVDCGTPADNLRANLSASGGRSVTPPGTAVEGQLQRSVVWPDGEVEPGEVLVDAVRYDGRRTVLVRAR